MHCNASLFSLLFMESCCLFCQIVVVFSHFRREHHKCGVVTHQLLAARRGLPRHGVTDSFSPNQSQPAIPLAFQVTFWDFSVERDEEAADNASPMDDKIPPQVMFIHQVCRNHLFPLKVSVRVLHLCCNISNSTTVIIFSIFFTREQCICPRAWFLFPFHNRFSYRTVNSSPTPSPPPPNTMEVWPSDSCSHFVATDRCIFNLLSGVTPKTGQGLARWTPKLILIYTSQKLNKSTDSNS